MASNPFGDYINSKREERRQEGDEIKLKDIAFSMGKTATYLSDIIKGRRNPPEKELIDKIADALKLNEKERTELYDSAGESRNEVAPDLPDYIMDDNIPHARIALRKAKEKGISDEFWQEVSKKIDDEKKWILLMN